MSDKETVAVFNQLFSRYPRAAAGLLEDVCADLGGLLHNQSDDKLRIAEICETLSQCFKPMDTPSIPQSYAWDAAYAMFGKWLMRDLPQYRDAVVMITGWNDDQIAKCRSYFVDMSRITRDDWVRAVQMIDQQTAGIDGMDAKGSIDHF